MRAKSLIAAFGSAVLAGGCGGSGGGASGTTPTDTAPVTGAIRAYLRASADGPAQAFCATLTTAAQRQAMQDYARTGDTGLPAKSCEQAYFGPPAGVQKQVLLTATISRLQVTGDVATARITGGTSVGTTVILKLANTNGRWLIDSEKTLGRREP